MENEGLGLLISKLAKSIKEDEGKFTFQDEIKFPITVTKISFNSGLPGFGKHDIGTCVAVRPVAEEYQDKTYLGIYLGDLLAPMPSYALVNATNELKVIIGRYNPAMFVPDISKVIWGYESWWGPIKNAGHLHKITDEDISNVWYVKALKQLSGTTEVKDE